MLTIGGVVIGVAGVVVAVAGGPITLGITLGLGGVGCGLGSMALPDQFIRTGKKRWVVTATHVSELTFSGDAFKVTGWEEKRCFPEPEPTLDLLECIKQAVGVQKVLDEFLLGE